ncbi:MAG: bifunctional nuclease family protein [Thermoanaerobaculia bacterium]
MSEPVTAGERWVEMEVKGLLLDPASETPVLLLQSVAGTIVLPIWIGQAEANAIAMALEGIREARPMTHDLMYGILQKLEVELPRIEIWALREGTFHGRLRLRRGDSEEHEVDARPSDAIALAVRSGASIWVAQGVVDEALQLDLATAEEEEERLRDWLEKARPEDLGKYKM